MYKYDEAGELSHWTDCNHVTMYAAVGLAWRPMEAREAAGLTAPASGTQLLSIMITCRRLSHHSRRCGGGEYELRVAWREGIAGGIRTGIIVVEVLAGVEGAGYCPG